MKLQLISGETSFQAAINTLKQINLSDRTSQNLVVVPDAFSMQAENLIFQTLQISATFNIEVVGISRLASKILRDNGIEFKRISSLEEVFCVFKATKTVERDFQFFKNCRMELCQKMLLVIKQFKACKILPEQIKEVGDENLDKKMHDLKLVYVEYEKLISEKLDLSKLLEFFINSTENLQNLSKINLFFCNFDSFTTEINSFIVALAKHVQSVNIGFAQPISPLNSHIYENDILQKTTSLAKAENLEVAVVSSPANLQGARLEIVKNVFALDLPLKNENFSKIQKKSEKLLEKSEKNAQKLEFSQKSEDYFLNVVAKNPRDEVEFLAKYIRFRLFHGSKMNDFAVAVSDGEYYDLIREIFPSYGILTNLDDAVTLSETILGSFLLKMLQFSKTDLKLEEFEYLCSNPLCGADEEAIKEIEFKKINDEKEFLQCFPKYENLINLIKNTKKCHNFAEFCSILSKFLKIVENNYQIFLSKIEGEAHYKKYSENSQSKELIEKTIEKIQVCGGDEKVELADFETLLNFAFSSVKVESIPSYVDAVFVGDATNSYFEDVDTLFVLGCDQLPNAQADLGMIDDEDIKKLRLNFALEPEIRVLNRRNRLKIFELLQHGRNALVTSTPFSREGKKSRTADFVSDLQRIFGEQTVRTVALEDFDLPVNSAEENLQSLLFYVGCEQNLLPAYSNLSVKNKLPRALAGSLSAVLKKNVVAPVRVSYLPKEPLLPQKSFSASRLETWFSCPFKHMVRYGFNIQEKKTVEPDAREFGSFVHEILRIFLTENEAADFDEEKIDEFLGKNVKNVALEFYDEKMIKNSYFMKNLTSLCKIILKNVIKEQKNSSFRPKFLEKNVNLKISEWNLTGRVDRVDTCKNYFRIIDFKTGQTGSIKTELFYGKKLQLFLYAKAMKNVLKEEIAGVYYFDAQSRFTKEKEILRGVTRHENEIVELSDSSMCEGKKGIVLGYSVKKSAKDGEFKYKKPRADDNLDEMIEYSVKIAENAMQEIATGFVLDSPFEDACQFCPYVSVCRHEKSMGKRKKISAQNENENDE